MAPSPATRQRTPAVLEQLKVKLDRPMIELPDAIDILVAVLAGDANLADASAEPPQKTKKRSQQVEKPHSAERELDLRERKGTPDKHRDIQQTAEQLEHARIAVKHLQAAGLHDLAKETARRAEDGERQLREERDGGHDQRDEAIKDLRREIRQMREELQAIRSKLPGSTGSSK